MYTIRTFSSQMNQSYEANRDANKYIESVQNNKEIINIHTTANDYIFYITVLLKDK